MLFGDANPGGKLPVTFPHTVGDLPDFYNHKPSASRSYAFSTRQPLYAFGSGLSYTTFLFNNLRVEPKQIRTGGTATVRVEVSNTGQREGDEVPQLYIHPRVSSVTQPVQQLKGFQRITLKPGEKKTVEFAVTPEMLSILNVDNRLVVEPGVYELMVGPSSDHTSTVKLTVTDASGVSDEAPLPPAGSESGMVSNFDDGIVAAKYGKWLEASDAMQGGKSMASLKIVQAGAAHTAGALQVEGEVILSDKPYAWAGAFFSSGSQPMQPVNLSSKKEIAFWAKGDGKSYTLMVQTQARSGQSGQPPAMTSFEAGAEWKQYIFPLSAFQTDGSDLMGVGFIRAGEAGKFQFQIDEVEIR